MAILKRLLILASSFKREGRCIAGREILTTGESHRLGRWVRPVSSHGEGELASVEARYGDGWPVCVLDVAEVLLVGLAGDVCQPENWHITSPFPWTDLGAGHRRPEMARLEERPAHLWLEPDQATDRTRPAYLQTCPPERSLVLIRPTGFRLQFQTTTSPAGVAIKRRCLFRYNETFYNLSLTDPILNARYESAIPGLGEPAREVVLPCGDDLLLCISLTVVFQGYHYKVVATVFENIARPV